MQRDTVMEKVAESGAAVEKKQEESQEQPDRTSSPTNLQSISQIANEYSQYLQISNDTERKAFEDKIEEILTRLDEFASVIDMIKSDTALCLQKTLPEVYQQSLEIQKTFDKIDQLEAFVNTVKENLDTIEEHVGKAETDLGPTFSAFRKVFSALPFKKKQNAETKPSEFNHPEIFHAANYFTNLDILPS